MHCWVYGFSLDSWVYGFFSEMRLYLERWIFLGVILFSIGGYFCGFRVLGIPWVNVGETLLCCWVVFVFVFVLGGLGGGGGGGNIHREGV